MAFGFLQRAGSLWGTGLAPGCRCLGATADTAQRLNRVLSKAFGLAVADESVIKLTNLQSDVSAIAERLQGWDALILGSDLGLCQRPVTANTYETSPNDKTYEVYWGPSPFAIETDEQMTIIKYNILTNVLQAAQQAGVQHIVAVDDDNDGHGRFEKLVRDTGIPFTYIRPVSDLVTIPNYNFKKGVQGKLSITPTTNTPPAAAETIIKGEQISREDLAALCVQALQSLDWTRRWSLQVRGRGPVDDSGEQQVNNPKQLLLLRPDQEWCVDSYRLEEDLLAGIVDEPK